MQSFSNFESLAQKLKSDVDKRNLQLKLLAIDFS
jgi:hypothetical protein